jgi:hypothetical protein
MNVAAVRRFRAWPIGLLLLLSVATPRADEFVPRNNPKRVQDAVDELTSRLAIDQRVTAVLVRSNPLLVSVERQKQSDGGFLLSFEDGFLEGLEDDELRAIVAHELGHVWIFTHHPFLQTEKLANDVAMRVVTRDSLERVYSKVWARGGTKGDLARFLGK